MIISEKDKKKGNIKLIIEYIHPMPIKYEKIFGLNDWVEIIEFCNTQINSKKDGKENSNNN